MNGIILFDEKEKDLAGKRNDGHITSQFKEPSLEQQVQISVNSAMSAPVLHVQLIKEREEHVLEH